MTAYTNPSDIPNYHYVDEKKLYSDIQEGIILQKYSSNTSFSFNLDDPIGEPVVTYMLNPKYNKQETKQATKDNNPSYAFVKDKNVVEHIKRTVITKDDKKKYKAVYAELDNTIFYKYNDAKEAMDKYKHVPGLQIYQYDVEGKDRYTKIDKVCKRFTVMNKYDAYAYSKSKKNYIKRIYVRC